MKQQSQPGSHGLRPPPPPITFMQMMRRLTKGVDSVPLLAALGTAATILTGFVVYQFAMRPDFKVLRVRSNATSGIDKPIDYHSNRLIWLTEKTDDTPKEVKELINSLR